MALNSLILQSHYIIIHTITTNHKKNQTKMEKLCDILLEMTHDILLEMTHDILLEMTCDINLIVFAFFLDFLGFLSYHIISSLPYYHNHIITTISSPPYHYYHIIIHITIITNQKKNQTKMENFMTYF